MSEPKVGKLYVLNDKNYEWIQLYSKIEPIYQSAYKTFVCETIGLLILIKQNYNNDICYSFL